MLGIVKTDWGATPPMASPGELVETMADAVGLPRATMVSHDRLLSEAGLRTKSGRGRGAAKVTPRDAAHLLTAVLASAEVRDTVHSVQRYAASRPRRLECQTAGFGHLGVPQLASLSADCSFIDALERLIAATADGSLREAFRSGHSDHHTEAAAMPAIEILAETPGTVAEIRVVANGGTASVMYTLPDLSKARSTAARRGSVSLEATVARLRPDRDLAQQRRISAHTLARIGALLQDEATKP